MCQDYRGSGFCGTEPTNLLIIGALRPRFASPTTLVFQIFLCIGDNCMSFFWRWGKWRVSARVKSEYPNSLSSSRVFLSVFFFPKRLITFSVEPTCLYLLYIV